MSRKVVRMTVDHLVALEAPCRTCLFWEATPVARASVDEKAAAAEAWMTEVLRDWGSCGRVVIVDGKVVGHAIYAPPGYFPGAARLATAPVSPDAVLLSRVHVDPHARGGGLGRMLIQGMARDLIRRGDTQRAVEAFGDTRGRSAPCVMPAAFLSGVGFRTQRAHGTTPRMRMELKAALTWKDEVEQAFERLLGAVRPAVGEARLR